MQVDKLLVELVLPDLAEEESGIKIRKLKYEVEKLINKLKDREDPQKCTDFPSGLEYRWELCEELQRICRSLHYIQAVQERYKMWKVRLHHLSERIKDIMRVDRSQQVKKMNDMSTHIEELESSKFYGNEALQVGLVEAYNAFIDRESRDLKFTMDWIKNDILSG